MPYRLAAQLLRSTPPLAASAVAGDPCKRAASYTNGISPTLDRSLRRLRKPCSGVEGLSQSRFFALQIDSEFVRDRIPVTPPPEMLESESVARSCRGHE